jgi:hypothetical protein
MTWKNFTFLVGLSWLIYGALYMDYPDWDIPVSFLMACSTYLVADRFWQSMWTLRYREWPALIIAAWWCVDGSYTVYWSIVNPSYMIREGQWLASLCLFLLCGAVWSLVPTQQPLRDTAKLGLQLVRTWWCSARSYHS